MPEPLRPRKAVVVLGSMRRLMSWRSWRFPARVTLRDCELDALGGHASLRGRVYAFDGGLGGGFGAGGFGFGCGVRGGGGAFYADYRDLVEAFLEGWGAEALGHLVHDVVGDLAVALGVAFEADGERDVEEDGLDFVAEGLRHLDPLAALVRAEVGGVDVVPGHLGDEARAEEAAEGAEDEALVALLGDVVEEDVAQQVAGERGDAAALVPGGFAGAGEADGEDDVAARGFVGDGFGAGGRGGEGLGLGLVDELGF